LRFKALAPCARLIDQARCVAYSARTVKEAPQCELGPVEHPAVARVRIDAGLGRWVRGQQGCDLSWRAVASVHCCCRLGRRPLCMHLQESAAPTGRPLCSIFFPQLPESGLVAAALGQLCDHASIALGALWRHDVNSFHAAAQARAGSSWYAAHACWSAPVAAPLLTSFFPNKLRSQAPLLQ